MLLLHRTQLKSQLKAIMAFPLAATTGRGAGPPAATLRRAQMSPVLSSKGTQTGPQT